MEEPLQEDPRVAEALQRGLSRLRHYREQHPAAPGERVDGRFEITAELGRGGFGVVYRARQLDAHGRAVALKLLRVRKSSGVRREDVLRSFAMERLATTRLSHPHIITVLGLGAWEREPGQVLPYLVTELLEGQTLEARLRGGPLLLEEALRIALQLLAALVFAHQQGVWHLDLKPSNLFLAAEDHLKVLDFGLARLSPQSPLLTDSNEAHTTALAGAAPLPYAATAAYLPPEEHHSRRRGPRTDVYAAAVILVEMLTGPHARQPGAAAWPALLHGLPEPLREVLARALHGDPELRFDDALSLRDALLQAQLQMKGGALASEELYRHLAPFASEHCGIFFGRERETAQLQRLLEEVPLCALVGASGAGKTSLLRAGLLPRLAGWQVLFVEPGAQPLRYLQDRLRALPALGQEEERHLLDTPALLLHQPLALGHLLRRLAECSQKRVLLLMDAFEECYTQSGEDGPQARVALAEALLGAADDAGGPVRVLLALREDFLSRLSETRELWRRVRAATLVLGAPVEEDLLAALVHPAARLGYRFAEGLPERVLRELRAEPTPLPLLQLTASKLWEARDREARTLGAAALERCGGVAGVLASHADQVLLGLRTPERRALAQELLCALVTTRGQRRALPRQQLLGSLPVEAEAVAVALLAGRLLSSFERDGEEWFGLIHESLVERWAPLRAWLQEDPALRRLRRQLQSDAAALADAPAPARFLWSGDDLTEALRQVHAGRLLPSAAERALLSLTVRAVRRRLLVRGAALLGSFLVLLWIALASFWAERRIRMEQARALAAARQAAVAASQATSAERQARSAEQRGSRETEARLTAVEAQRVEAERRRAAEQVQREQEVKHRREAEQARATIAASLERQQRAEQERFAAIEARQRESEEGRQRQLDAVRRVTDELSLAARVLRQPGGGEDALRRILHVLAEAGQLDHPPDNTALILAEALDAVARQHGRAGVGALLLVRTFAGPVAGLQALAVAPRGQRALLGGANGGALLLSLTEEQPARALSGGTQPLAVVAFSDDGRRALTAGQDGAVRIYDSESGALLQVLPVQGGPLLGAAFDRSGLRVYTAAADGRVRLTSLVTGGSQILSTLKQGPLTLSRAPQRDLVAVAAPGHFVQLLGTSQAAPGEVVADLHGPPGFAVPRRLALAPDGRRLAVAGPNESMVLLWDTETRQRQPSLTGHEDGVGALAMAPDGERLLSVGLDGVVRLWELQRPSLHLTFRDVSNRPLGAAAYLPDGQHILVGSDDGAARLYRVSTADLVDAACELSLPALKAVCSDFKSRRKMTPRSPTSHR